MDLGCGSGTMGARWHNRRNEKSKGKGKCSHNDHPLFADCIATLHRKSAGNETEACVGSVIMETSENRDWRWPIVPRFGQCRPVIRIIGGPSMTHFVGLDVSQKITAICVVDDAGRRTLAL